MTLSGKTILITRAAHQAADFVRAIEQHGGIAITFPTIEILPPVTWDACDRALANLYMYDGILFTSTNGVEFFFRRMAARDVSATELKSKMIFVVGEKTKQAVEQKGCTVNLMPDKFSASDLAKNINQLDLHGRSFLFPRGNLGKDVLQDNLKLLGARVDSVTVYQTTKPAQANISKVKSMLLNGKIDIATFTSPSTFKNFAGLFSEQELKEIAQKTKIAVIGPATASVMEDANFEADIIPPQSTVESLIDAIALSFKSGIPAARDRDGRTPESEMH